ncbi:hypothetical protein CNMCM5623_009042 [Aspergillus felis]|uniref:aldehyde dehydrogenase (NAD(+)) n=1 Tax=Aspergillus felis TaxID=1287682 RepID=A0A8H6USS8_9EURO|nr:hypothetical protein CNMCM5623_009042 [Aspergillus felis]
MRPRSPLTCMTTFEADEVAPEDESRQKIGSDPPAPRMLDALGENQTKSERRSSGRPPGRTHWLSASRNARGPTARSGRLSLSSNAAFPWRLEALPNKVFINNEVVTARSSLASAGTILGEPNIINSAQYIDASNGIIFQLQNPKDGSALPVKVPVADEVDVDRAVKAAEAASVTWRKSTADARRVCMEKLVHLMEGHKDILISPDPINHGHANKLAGECHPKKMEDGLLKIVQNEPLGVTAGITAWNGPLGMAAQKSAPALATGNCFILKPSEQTPLASLALGALIKESRFPSGVFQVLSGNGPTGSLLAEHMRIRKISFTGSTETGRKIQQAAAQSNLKRVTLELGGKSPGVVFDDANVDNAVFWCMNSILAITGQACFAASRVYVQEGINEEFRTRYKTAVEERASLMGDPESPQTMLGPVADSLQFDRASGFLVTGKEEGSVLTGGEAAERPGYYITPTAFENVDRDADIIRQEIFGPVAISNIFKDEKEVIDLANNSEYGRMAGVFTQDVNRALRVTSELDSGNVGINCISMIFTNVPFGGMTSSGHSRENGKDVLFWYTESKSVFINLMY